MGKKREKIDMKRKRKVKSCLVRVTGENEIVAHNKQKSNSIDRMFILLFTKHNVSLLNKQSFLLLNF